MKNMKSRGKDQGYKCKKCGRTSQNKTSKEIPRKIKAQLYLPVLSAHRHLTRPLQRISRFNTKIEFDNSEWFCNLI
jgi:tRNA(Ile2)-agmatinylcytidine synthase